MADDLERIRGNVRRMLEQNAPSQDIDRYLSGEGVSPEMLRGAPGARAPSEANAPPQAPAAPSVGAQIGAAIGRAVPPPTPREQFAQRWQESGGWQGIGNRLGDVYEGVTGGLRAIRRGSTPPMPGVYAPVNPNSTDPRFERDRQLDARFNDAHPVLAPVLEGLGAVASQAPLLAVTGGIGATLPKQIVAGAVSNGLLSGAISASRGEDPVAGGLKGAAIGAGAPIVGAGVSRVASAIKGTRAAAAPTTDALRTQADQLYRAAENAGVVVSAQGYTDLVTDLVQTARQAGFHPGLHNAITVALREAARPGATPQSLQRLDQLRRIIRSAGNDMTNPDQARIAGQLVDRLDDFLDNLSPSQVAAGNQAGVQALTEGRRVWAQVRKSEVIEDLVERARNAVGANYTVAGMSTALRQQFRAIANNPRQFSRFSFDEQRQIISIIRGGPIENGLRLIGKFAPDGPVSITLGMLAGGWPVMAAGLGGKIAAGAATLSKVRGLENTVRGGQPALPKRLQPVDEATTRLLQMIGTPTVNTTTTAKPRPVYERQR